MNEIRSRRWVAIPAPPPKFLDIVFARTPIVTHWVAAMDILEAGFQVCKNDWLTAAAAERVFHKLFKKIVEHLRGLLELSDVEFDILVTSLHQRCLNGTSLDRL